MSAAAGTNESNESEILELLLYIATPSVTINGTGAGAGAGMSPTNRPYANIPLSSGPRFATSMTNRFQNEIVEGIKTYYNPKNLNKVFLYAANTSAALATNDIMEAIKQRAIVDSIAVYQLLISKRNDILRDPDVLSRVIAVIVISTFMKYLWTEPTHNSDAAAYAKHIFDRIANGRTPVGELTFDDDLSKLKIFSVWDNVRDAAKILIDKGRPSNEHIINSVMDTVIKIASIHIKALVSSVVYTYESVHFPTLNDHEIKELARDSILVTYQILSNKTLWNRLAVDMATTINRNSNSTRSGVNAENRGKPVGGRSITWVAPTIKYFHSDDPISLASGASAGAGASGGRRRSTRKHKHRRKTHRRPATRKTAHRRRH